MPSDRPPPEPPSPGSDPAGRRRATSAVRDGTLVFALVLGAFVAYALGATATYRATAVVAVEPIPGSPAVQLPTEAAQLLRRAALEPALVATLAAEERAKPPETLAQVGSRIAGALSVDKRDAKSFAFSTTAPRPERAQRIVNELAQQAARRAVEVLDPQPQPKPEPDPAARVKAELLDFLAAHPGIGSEPTTPPSKPGRDPLILALRAERLRIAQKLAEPPAPPTGENPYEVPTTLENPTLLKRRLQEIDVALEARAKAAAPDAAKPDASKATREIRAEWQRLLRAVNEAKSPEPAAPSRPRLRVTLARASLPGSPVEPDRPRVVLLGVLVSSIVGLLAGLLRGKMETRAVRRYGTTTARNPIFRLPQTTVRIPREQLPKPLAPRNEPLPTPVPEAPASAHPMTPIPAPPLVPHAITSVPAAPLVPSPITPIPPAPRATKMSPIPPAPLAPTLITPIPPGPSTQPLPTPSPPAVAAPVTPTPPAPTGSITPTPPVHIAPATPIPPGGVAPPPETSAAMAPLGVRAPAASTDPDAPPTTQSYEERKEPARPARAGRRITQIYGTPPAPDFKDDPKALRTTQAYGSPIVADPPHPAGAPTPYPAEVVLPAHRSSLRPVPMIPLSKSSTPPPATAATRSSIPLVETSYSYVQTPVPESHSVSIPQTPPPRRPSPAPRTEPYGSAPPIQSRTPTSDPPVQRASKTNTPVPPDAAGSPSGAVRTHPVAPNWRPDPTLVPERRQALAAEILTLAVDRCLVVSVTGVRGTADKKSMAAAELALALAEAKHPRVLLVESDFQFPQVHKWMALDLPLSAGFSQQLRGRIDSGKAGRWHVVECKPSLHVLAEGIMRSPGLLLSNQFEQALRELRRGHYGVIVIDTPIAPNEADGHAIADVADGAIVVGSAARANEAVEVSRIFSGKKLLRVVES